MAATVPCPVDVARPDPGLVEVARSETALRTFLRGLGAVEPVGLADRARRLAGRSVTGSAEARTLDLAIGLVDLTTLEGADTPGTVRALCARARRPDPADPTCPAVAAVCVYPALVATAAAELTESGVRVASVATAFPSGQAPLDVRLAEVAAAVAAGADEIDMVINRSAFLSGRYRQVYEEIVAVREACGGARLKVILETAELGTYDNVRRAAWLAMLAGADFLKTSTGKVRPGATLPATLVLLEAVRDLAAATGRRVGVKAAGGIRTARDAIRYLVLVDAVLGADWLHPDRFRFGASALLTDLVARRTRVAAGTAGGPERS
ncbi:MAG: deoxyribose-phosphate aldolase [Micromonosporaceae bacterium]|jgi:deoxyribose-phosphate aldolase